MTDERCALAAGIGILTVLVGWQFARAVDIGCPARFDCIWYIAMAKDWLADDKVIPHLAMRVLPAMLVQGLGALGVSIHDGYKLLSYAGYAGFAFGCFAVLCRQRHPNANPVMALALTLIIITASPLILHSLELVYQANNALTYPLTLALIVLTQQRRLGLLMVVAVLGVLTRQNMFALAGLSFFFLFVTAGHRNERVLAGLGMTALSGLFIGLTQYYDASESVLRHLTVGGGTGIPSWESVARFVATSHAEFLLLPLVPLLVLVHKESLAAFRRHWYLIGYAFVVAYQTSSVFEIAGWHNFHRLAIEGIWPLYLLVAIALMKKPPSVPIQSVLLVYGLGLFASSGNTLRLGLVAGVLIGFAVCVVLSNRAQSKASLGPVSGA
jgi:hypothetical protein